MPRVNINLPRPNTTLSPDQEFVVQGMAADRGWPEPIAIDSAFVRIDGGTPTDADLTGSPAAAETVYSFDAHVRAPSTTGPHNIAVTAVNDRGQKATESVTVFVGRGPLFTEFTGTAILVTSSTEPGLKTPPPGSMAGALEFTFDHTSARITRLDPVVVRVPEQPIVGIVTVTITRNPGEPAATFDPATGAMTLPLGLHFAYDKHMPFLLQDSDVSFGFPTGNPLTTGTAVSPSGLLTATGAPRNAATGAIRLAGASRFTGGAPLGGLECTLTVVGTFAQIP